MSSNDTHANGTNDVESIAVHLDWIRELERTITPVQGLESASAAIPSSPVSKPKLRYLSDASPTGYIVHNRSGLVSQINPAAALQLGLSPKDGFQPSLLQFLTPDEAGSWLDHMRCAAELRPAITDFILRRYDGKLTAIRLTTVAVPNSDRQSPKTFRTTLTVIDTEDVLRQSQIDHQCLIDTIEGIVWEANAATLDFTFVSRHAERLLGYPLAYWKRPGFWYDRIHVEDRDRVANQIGKAVANLRETQIDYRVLAADRRVIWLHDKIAVVKRAGKIRLLGVAIDVTERRRAQTQLRQAHDLLEPRVAGVIAGVTTGKRPESALLEQLAHASRVSTASSIAHELNQPLSAILCNTQAAQLFLNQEPPALGQLRDILGDICKATQRTGEIIESIRTLLLEHGTKRQLLEINLLAEDVLRLVKEDAVSRRIRITIELAPQLPAVEGNRVQLQQVVLNLIMNAMDAVAQQPPEQRRLTLSTNLGSGGAVEVSVSDSGPGVEPRNFQRLFQPFFTTKEGGLGIGLSLAQKIVTAHRGSIWAENGPSGGAVFHMVLPALKAKGEADGGKLSTW